MSQVNEISKGTIGSYLKKTPASAADAGNKMASQGMNPKASMQKGVKGIVKRSKGVSMAVDKMTGKSKVPASESVSEAKFVIPEAVPTTERNAFHRQAADAHKAGRTHFSFMGKKYPVTIDPDYAATVRGEQKEATDDAMKAYLAKGGKITKLPPGKAQGYHGKDDPGKDVAGNISKDDTKAMGTKKKVKSMEKKDDSVTMNPIMKKDNTKTGMEQKESTIREKLLAVLEAEDRSKHYKGATPPEEIDSKMSPGGKKMKSDVETGAQMNKSDETGADDVAQAGRVTKVSPANRTDKNAPGDKNIINKPNDITQSGSMKNAKGFKEETQMEDNKVIRNIALAYQSMYGTVYEGNDEFSVIYNLDEASTGKHDHKKVVQNIDKGTFKTGLKHMEEPGVSGQIAKHGHVHAKAVGHADFQDEYNATYAVHDKKSGKTHGVNIHTTIKANPSKIAKSMGHKQGKIHSDIANFHNSSYNHTDTVHKPQRSSNHPDL